MLIVRWLNRASGGSLQLGGSLRSKGLCVRGKRDTLLPKLHHRLIGNPHSALASIWWKILRIACTADSGAFLNISTDIPSRPLALGDKRLNCRCTSSRFKQNQVAISCHALCLSVSMLSKCKGCSRSPHCPPVVSPCIRSGCQREVSERSLPLLFTASHCCKNALVAFGKSRLQPFFVVQALSLHGRCLGLLPLRPDDLWHFLLGGLGQRPKTWNQVPLGSISPRFHT